MDVSFFFSAQRRGVRGAGKRGFRVFIEIQEGGLSRRGRGGARAWRAARVSVGDLGGAIFSCFSGPNFPPSNCFFELILIKITYTYTCVSQTSGISKTSICTSETGRN